MDRKLIRFQVFRTQGNSTAWLGAKPWAERQQAGRKRSGVIRVLLRLEQTTYPPLRHEQRQQGEWVTREAEHAKPYLYGKP